MKNKEVKIRCGWDRDVGGIELFSVATSSIDSVGNSGGILCVWDPNAFRKNSVTLSDYFILVRGVWEQNGMDLLIVVVYAPHDAKEKIMLWDYLASEINRWRGKVVVMGDFNEVRFRSDRFGSIFNAQGANVFNSFISNAGLVEVELGGCSFTWCHKTAKKMSKLDRFLVSDNLLHTYPHLSAISLERFLSDHRPILLREHHLDYGPTPFRFFHYWCEIDGFKNLVEDAWKDSPNNEAEIDRGIGNEEIVAKRMNLVKNLQDINNLNSMEMAQKSNVKWAVEGDENSSFFHGTINKKRNVLANDVYKAVSYFFLFGDIPKGCNSSFIVLIPKFPGANMVKDFRPISLIGSLYKIIAKVLANRLVDKLGSIVNEVQSAFVKDRQILDGPFILDELIQWCKKKRKHLLVFKVDFEKAFDSVRWDFLDDLLFKFGFGGKWRKWIQSFYDKHNMVAYLKKPTGSEGFQEIVDFLNGSHIRYALTKNPTIYVSLIKKFWQTATVRTVDNGEQEITAIVDSKEFTFTKASVRRHLQLADAYGISALPNTKIFEQLSLMGYVFTDDKLTFQKGKFSPQWRFLIHTILHCLSPKKTSWEQFSSNIATAVICLATNKTFNFSKFIFDGMVKNLDSKYKFLMYLRFL
ncbi:RNA-directed DNA polymerase, eukaryota [Tanacetum coccineum]